MADEGRSDDNETEELGASPDSEDEQPQHLPATVDQGLAQASGPPVRVTLDAEQRARVAEAQVVQLETAARQASDDRRLRKGIAKTATKGAFVQVAIADVVFLIYGFANGWNLPAGTMPAWLGAAVVQVIAVAIVVARSLFPTRDVQQLPPPQDSEATKQ